MQRYQPNSCNGSEHGRMFIENVKAWSLHNELVQQVLVVGSYARGEARPDSDVDVIILCTSPALLLQRREWMRTFGEVQDASQTQYHTLTTLSVRYATGLNVEFGVTGVGWLDQLDCAEVGAVLQTGARWLYKA